MPLHRVRQLDAILYEIVLSYEAIGLYIYYYVILLKYIFRAFSRFLTWIISFLYITTTRFECTYVHSLVMHCFTKYYSSILLFYGWPSDLTLLLFVLLYFVLDYDYKEKCMSAYI